MHDDDIAYARLGAHKYEKYVNAQFEVEKARALARGEESAKVPYIGWPYCIHNNEELIAIYKREVCLGLAARKHFREHRPFPGAPDLPLSRAEHEQLENDDDVRLELVSCYANSLCWLGYDYLIHPPFHPYVCGVLARPDAPDYLRTPEVIREFPPCLLEGLDQALCWKTPEMVAKRLQIVLRNRQYERGEGMPADDDWVTENIVAMGQIYPSKFAPNSRAF
jgi:hypothetical protein